MPNWSELWPPIRLTLELAGATTLLLLLIATPIAWWLARSQARWKEAVAAVVALPLPAGFDPTTGGVLDRHERDTTSSTQSSRRMAK